MLLRRPTPYWLALGLVLALTVSRPARADDLTPLAGFDDYVTAAMKAWRVPGVAVAVVKDGKVVLSRGYGVKKLGDPAAVDANTRFAIGSCTKAFTAAGLGMLVDEGKLAWDDPVTKYLPTFQLHDPYVTREITLRDLLCHRTGLSRSDSAWYGSAAGRAELVRRMRYLKPASSFRSTWGYNNFCYLAAGEVIPAVTHTSWDDFITRRLFAPLGMTSSTVTLSAIDGVENVANPHQDVDGQVRPVPYRNIDNIGPAGSIISTVTDMAYWVRMLLAKGVGPKGRLLGEKRVEDLFHPQMLMPGFGGVKLPENHFVAYGLGWVSADYRGTVLVWHTGGIDGMNSVVGLVPEKHLGVVVLTNFAATERFPSTLVYRIADAYLRATPRDWSGELLVIDTKNRARAAEAKAQAEKRRVPGTESSLAIEDYVGTYRDDLHGDATVRLEKEALVIHTGASFVGTLEHWHFDTFRIRWRDPVMPPELATFQIGTSGMCVGLKLIGFGEEDDGERVEFKRLRGGGGK